MDTDLWDELMIKPTHVNAIYELIGVQDRAVTGELIVPHLKRIYDLLKEHYGQR